MSGPGWMPSRPRPLGQVRRRLVSYASYLPRRLPRRAHVPGPGHGHAPATPPDAHERGDNLPCGRFFNRRVKLPVATLLPSGTRVLAGTLHGWCAQRWLWIRPRLIPLIVAFAGLVGMLNARRYLLELARGPARPAVVEIAPAVHAVHVACPGEWAR